jgi:hypothetical protein
MGSPLRIKPKSKLNLQVVGVWQPTRFRAQWQRHQKESVDLALEKDFLAVRLPPEYPVLGDGFLPNLTALPCARSRHGQETLLR